MADPIRKRSSLLVLSERLDSTDQVDMHHVLLLEEILFNVFSYCHPQNEYARRADLAALARTCRTFKEPALDVLWAELTSLSPLARCLPEVSQRLYPGCSWYAFTRPLTDPEWNTLRTYSRRIRSIHDFTRELTWESVKTLFDPPTPEPMFPHLRTLRWEFIKETFPLMRHLAVPSLTSLEINFVLGDMPPLQSFPLSLGDLCPGLRKVHICMRRPQPGSNEVVSGLVCRWAHLQALSCPCISLDLDAFAHLSRASSLERLSFKLSGAIAERILSSGDMFSFPKLRQLELSSGSLQRVSRTLAHVQLPAIESLTIYIGSCPSKYALGAFFVTLQRICTLHSLENLKVTQMRSADFSGHVSEQIELTFEDMFPCTAFSNLRLLDVNVASIVSLGDDNLLQLASAWPRLEQFLINEKWGWKTEGGISPNGLLQLLQMLPYLHSFCLAIDTRGYTDVRAATSTVAGVKPRVPFSVNVADSIVGPESVDALAAFFGAIMEQHANVTSWYWSTSAMTGRRDTEILERLWEGVFVKAHERVRIQYRIG